MSQAKYMNAKQEAIDVYHQKIDTIKGTTEVTQEQNSQFTEMETAVGAVAESTETLDTDYQALTERVKENQTEINDLNKANETLQAGNSLTSEQLTELIAKYPEIVEQIAATGDVTLQGGERLPRTRQKSGRQQFRRNYRQNRKS